VQVRLECLKVAVRQGTHRDAVLAAAANLRLPLFGV
jgi:hypothetical protein